MKSRWCPLGTRLIGSRLSHQCTTPTHTTTELEIAGPDIDLRKGWHEAPTGQFACVHQKAPMVRLRGGGSQGASRRAGYEEGLSPQLHAVWQEPRLWNQTKTKKTTKTRFPAVFMKESGTARLPSPKPGDTIHRGCQPGSLIQKTSQCLDPAVAYIGVCLHAAGVAHLRNHSTPAGHRSALSGWRPSWLGWSQ
jgi:hypothetical protein